VKEYLRYKPRGSAIDTVKNFVWATCVNRGPMYLGLSRHAATIQLGCHAAGHCSLSVSVEQSAFYFAFHFNSICGVVCMTECLAVLTCDGRTDRPTDTEPQAYTALA